MISRNLLLVGVGDAHWFIENCKYSSIPCIRLRSSWNLLSHRCSTSVANLNINFWEVKVKVQGQNRRNENLRIVTALIGRGLRYLHQIWKSNRCGAIGSNVGMKYFRQNSRWRPGRGLCYCCVLHLLFVRSHRVWRPGADVLKITNLSFHQTKPVADASPVNS